MLASENEMTQRVRPKNNRKMKSKLFGVLLLIEAAALLLTAAVALHYQRVAGEGDANCFLLTAGLTGALGLLLFNIGRGSRGCCFPSSGCCHS